MGRKNDRITLEVLLNLSSDDPAVERILEKNRRRTAKRYFREL